MNKNYKLLWIFIFVPLSKNEEPFYGFLGFTLPSEKGRRRGAIIDFYMKLVTGYYYC